MRDTTLHRTRLPNMLAVWRNALERHMLLRPLAPAALIKDRMRGWFPDALVVLVRDPQTLKVATTLSCLRSLAAQCA